MKRPVSLPLRHKNYFTRSVPARKPPQSDHRKNTARIILEISWLPKSPRPRGKAKCTGVPASFVS